MTDKPKKTYGPRRVKALQATYIDHAYRKRGEEFVYSGEPSPSVLLELDGGDTSPVSSSVPRTKFQTPTSIEGSVDDLI